MLQSKEVLLGAAATCSVALALTGVWYLQKGNNKKGQKKLPSPLDTLLVEEETLRELIVHLHSEMRSGLKGESSFSSLKMLPTYVSKPTGEERGTFYALDLGGTNFRIIELELLGHKLGKSNMKKFVISKESMSGTAQQLFDFIAQCVKEFLEEMKEVQQQTQQQEVSLGFTFSFPVNQHGIASGTLINWTKGFSTSGVEGEDVVNLLNEAFKRNNIQAKTVALANDTVGTMVARCYMDNKCEMGVILGTGSNACYAEQTANLQKPAGNFKGDNMIINMEWGALGDTKDFLPLSEMDKELDEASINPSKQLFEKMISGMYLGEIVRLTLVKLIQNGSIFSKVDASSLKKRNTFETVYISQILDDHTSHLQLTEELLQEKLGVKGSTLDDRNLLRETCEIVAYRAARLSATAIAAVLKKIDRLNNCVVAVDGSVFEHVPKFKQVMDETIKLLFPESSVQLQLTTDGSGNGAAIIAATVVNS